MNVLVVEYFTGGGLCGRSLPDDPSSHLRREGESMLLALVGDLLRIPGVRVITTRDARLPPPAIEGVDVRVIREADNWVASLRELLDSTDAFWPIAPETGQVLESLCALCDDAGRLLLNSSAEAVRCTASKYRTAKALEEAGLPCVKTWRAADECYREAAPGGEWVVKPDDGIGCEGVRIVSAVPRTARVDDVVQPYIEGRAASLSVLYGGGEHRLAGLNLQEIERRGDELLLRACIVNGVRHRRRDFDTLAKRIGHAIAGLAGYVGIDCIERDGDIRVVEINPRLTTSYVGLRRSLGINPAACVLSLLTQAATPFFDIESAAAVRVGV